MEVFSSILQKCFELNMFLVSIDVLSYDHESSVVIPSAAYRHIPLVEANPLTDWSIICEPLTKCVALQSPMAWVG